jgi:hypothetical protein
LTEEKSSTHSDTAGVGVAGGERSAGGLALGDVVDGDEDARPIVLVAGQDRALEADVHAAAGQRVVGRLALKGAAAVPELDQLIDVALEHVAAEDLVEIGDEVDQVVGLEQLQRALVDVDDADQTGAVLDSGGVRRQEAADVCDALSAPGVELDLDPGVVLNPERDRGEGEHGGGVARRTGGRNRGQGCLHDVDRPPHGGRLRRRHRRATVLCVIRSG